MSETVNKRPEKEYLSCELVSLTDHGVNYQQMSPSKLLRHMRDRRVRCWLITQTCRNCPGHFRVRRSVDSRVSLLKDMMRVRCPMCLEDSLEFFKQDLGSAKDDEPCVSFNGKVWE